MRARAVTIELGLTVGHSRFDGLECLRCFAGFDAPGAQGRVVDVVQVFAGTAIFGHATRNARVSLP